VTLLQILVVLAVVAAVAAVAAGVWRGGPVDAHDAAEGPGLPEPTTTVPPLELPVDRVTADDVDGLHFSLGLRGYRMDEVDQVLDRIASELRSRDAEVALLREQAAAGRMAGGGPSAPTDDDPTDDDPTDEDDAADDSVVASTEGSVAGFGGFGATAGDRASSPDARER
jgi:DivIVA domain-containing protein